MSEINISRQDYYDEIESMVNIIENEMSEYPDRELTETVFESVDSHKWILYNDYNIHVLRWGSDPDEWQHFVSDDMDYREVLQAMAFCTMRQDVWDEIHDRDSIDY
jgi:hypothetical protein